MVEFGHTFLRVFSLCGLENLSSRFQNGVGDVLQRKHLAFNKLCSKETTAIFGSVSTSTFHVLDLVGVIIIFLTKKNKLCFHLSLTPFDLFLL